MFKRRSIFLGIRIVLDHVKIRRMLQVAPSFPCLYTGNVTCVSMMQKHNIHKSTVDNKKLDFHHGGYTDGKELFASGEEFIQSIKRSNLLPDELDDRINKLSGVLYQFLIRNDEENLVNFFNMMTRKRLINEAAYTIVMRYYAECNDLENVQRLFNLLNENSDVEVHSRSYVPLIVVCLKLGKYKLADEYLDEMSETIQMKYKDNVVQDILNTCVKLRNHENVIFINGFVERIFTLLEKYGTTDLKPKTVDAIVNWFESEKDNTWKIQPTSIGRNNGMCQYCKKRLNSADILPERLLKLKRNLTTLVKASIVRKQTARITDVKHLKTNINIKNNINSKSKYFEFYDLLTMDSKHKDDSMDSSYTETLLTPQCTKDASIDLTSEFSGEQFEKLNNLKGFLNNNGKYHVVIDALNIGYFTHGFNPLQVRDLVQYFIDRNKRVLILCAGIMKQELITTKEVALSNRRIQQLMLFLDKHCSLFFVGSSVVDDYYILYTLIHHNFQIELVSRDLFRDHLFHLDSENTADFQRWQKAHQYIMKAFKPDGTPIFKARMDFNQAMQRHENGWHVPVNERSWLCISKLCSH